ncbi:hypothetical protein [Pseudomonas sp. TWP3-1]|uniref:hypothetical protein n=1 Tax=Pseudomonas sp. TWP3-1 TaxID=2804631 RepID=UPI003CEC1C0D
MIEIKLLFAATSIALLVLIITNVLVMIYVGYFKLSEIESHLENCHLLHTPPQKGSGGFWERRYRLNLITALLRKRPSRLLLDDPSAIEDVRSLPLNLRRWVEIPYRFNAFSLLGILALYGWAEYLGLLK